MIDSIVFLTLLAGSVFAYIAYLKYPKPNPELNDTGMNVEQIALMLVKQQLDDIKQDTDSSIQTELYVATIKQSEENEPKISDLIHIEEDRYEALINEIDSLKQLIIHQQKYMDEQLKKSLLRHKWIDVLS